MKNIVIIMLLSFTFSIAGAQEKKSRKQIRAEREAAKIEETRKIINTKEFVFKATQALPMGGSAVHLNYDFDFSVKGDSITSYLPFYGRAYQAQIGQTEGPFDFSNTIEHYELKESKKGYEVKITVRNKNDKLDYTLRVSENGSATLNLNSMHRQSMTYYGNVEKPKVEEKK